MNAPPLPSLRELGSDLLHVTPLQRCLTLAYPFLWCAGYFLLAAWGYWVFASFCLVGLSFVTYGSTSHDLVHGNLGLSRKTNECFLSLIEWLALRSGHAYQAAHLHHHARFPHADDIESSASRKSFLGALAEGFVFQGRIWIWALRHSPTQRVWIIAEGLACIAVIILAPLSPILLVYVGLMLAGSWIIPLATSYLPHDPQAETELLQTRVFRGKVASVLAVEHLYHWEHHLFPRVPHVHWPTLAKRLDPFLEQAGIRPIKFWI